MKFDEAQLLKLVKNLHISREEAIEVMKYDKEVDKAGAKEKLEYDLTDEQQKAAKQNTITSRGSTGKQTNRKKDETKASITAKLVAAIEQGYSVEVDVTNPERQFNFILNGEKYEVTITKKKK